MSDMPELFLIAQIAGRGVAIEAGQVDSVVDIGEIVAVPRAEAAIRGLVALRSRVVTVIDTGVMLGVGMQGIDGGGIDPGSRRAVITRVDGHHYAIMVDSLEDIAPFARVPISSGLALDRGWASVGTGMIERDGEPLLVIDLTALVPGLVPLAA